MKTIFYLPDEMQVKPLKDFLQLFKDQKLTDSLPVFNNLIYTKGELLTSWEIPLQKSWLAERVQNSVKVKFNEAKVFDPQQAFLQKSFCYT